MGAAAARRPEEAATSARSMGDPPEGGNAATVRHCGPRADPRRDPACRPGVTSITETPNRSRLARSRRQGPAAPASDHDDRSRFIASMRRGPTGRELRDRQSSERAGGAAHDQPPPQMVGAAPKTAAQRDEPCSAVRPKRLRDVEASHSDGLASVG